MKVNSITVMRLSHIRYPSLPSFLRLAVTHLAYRALLSLPVFGDTEPWTYSAAA